MDPTIASCDAPSSRDEGSAASLFTTSQFAASSSAPPSSSGSLTPSRGVKRSRDIDATEPSQFPSTTAEEPPSKRAYESPASAGASSSNPSPSVASGDSLRISNELLRSDNDHLQKQLAQIEADKAALDAQLTQQKQRVRNLEEDLTRIYRRQKREAETRQAEHSQAIDALKEQLERITKQLDDRPTVDPTMALLTPETTQEMDAFVAMCSQWQHKLTTLSEKLASQVARAEQAEVKAVMDGMVHRVDDAYRLSEVQAAEKAVVLQRAVMRQQEQDMQSFVERMKAEREEAEAFESTERLVLEQRVEDLEKTVENAKQHERVLLRQMSDLRDQLVKMRSGNHVLPESEWQKKVQEEAQMKHQLEELSVRCEAQNVQLTLLREDLSSLQAENDELAADLIARKKAAAGDDDTASIVTKQLEDRIAELKEQLADAKKKAREAETELRAELTTKMHDECEKLNNRVEILNLNVETKAKVIENLTADKTQLLARVADEERRLEALQGETALLQQQLDAKNHKIETLQYEMSELELNYEAKMKQALDEANSEKLELQKQMTSKTCDWVELNRELKEFKRQLESKSLELRNLTSEKSAMEAENNELRRKGGQLQQEVASLEAKAKEVVEEQQKQSIEESRLLGKLTSVEQEKQKLEIEASKLRAQLTSVTLEKPAPQLQNGNASLPPEIQARIAKLLVEKRAVENFLKQYFEAAEAKCRSLSVQVADLEAKQATHRAHAQDSCQLLRMCTQIDGCDSTIRASLLDVMTTLESIS